MGPLQYHAGVNLTPGQFIRHRIARIVPLYWSVTLFAMFALNLSADEPHLFAGLLRSLFFIAYVRPGALLPVSPIVSVGWTLNLEMMFYALFALGLACCRARLVTVLAAALVLMAVIGKLLPPTYPIANFYTAGLIVEFAAGLLIARAFAAGRFWPAPGMGAGLLIAGILLLVFPPPVGARVALWGLPATLTVLGSLALEPVLKRRPVPLLRHLGDASYSLYLIRLLVQGPILRGLESLGLPLTIWTGLLTLCLTLVPASIIHLYYEKPLNRLARRLMQPHPAPLAGPPPT